MSDSDQNQMMTSSTLKSSKRMTRLIKNGKVKLKTKTRRTQASYFKLIFHSTKNHKSNEICHTVEQKYFQEEWETLISLAQNVVMRVEENLHWNYIAELNTPDGLWKMEQNLEFVKYVTENSRVSLT